MLRDWRNGRSKHRRILLSKRGVSGLRKEREGEHRAKGTLWQTEYCATQMQDMQEDFQ